METPANVTVTSCDSDICKDVLNILVLVTPEATAELTAKYNNLPSTQQSLMKALFVGTGELTLNVALMNSGIIGKSARFVTEDFENFSFSPTFDITADLNQLINNTPEAADRWVANRADMLILLTDSRYGKTYGVASGSYPLAIVSVGTLGAPRFTFTHEIGHLLEANHNRNSNGGDAGEGSNCNFGYRFPVFGGIFYEYTIMAVLNQQNEPNATRILYFSNPNINFYDGSPIGTNDTNNSAFISAKFCEKADLFADSELSVSIDGPSTLHCNESAFYTADIHLPGAQVPGLPPFTFSWLLGESPFTSPVAPGVIPLGHNSIVPIQANDIPFDNFWLLLWITSSDGVMTTDLINVHNIPCSPYPKTALKQHFDVNSAFAVYPNPTKDVLMIEGRKNFGNAPKVLDQYSIYNISGNLINSGVLDPDLGNTIPLNLPNGFYTITFKSDDETITRKFIVQY